jgi:hypothetical protein
MGKKREKDKGAYTAEMHAEHVRRTAEAAEAEEEQRRLRSEKATAWAAYVQQGKPGSWTKFEAELERQKQIQAAERVREQGEVARHEQKRKVSRI